MTRRKPRPRRRRRAVDWLEARLLRMVPLAGGKRWKRYENALIAYCGAVRQKSRYG